MAKAFSPTKVVVPCRISFANIWEPKTPMGGGDPKYSVSCLIPEADTKTRARIDAAIEAAKKIGMEKKWGGKIPPNLKLPIHTGSIDRPDDENYVGMIYFNASAKDRPQIVDRQVQPILDPMEVGSGDYCNVSVNFYPFSASGNRGVAVGLGNIQLVKHGERLSGKASASSDFEALGGDDDDGDILGGGTPSYL